MIYAVGVKTKRHAIYNKGAPLGDEEFRVVTADSDGWIPWAGETDSSPVPDVSLCRIRLSDGCELETFAPEEWSWSRGGDQHIIAYRPILDAKPEAPKWRGPKDGSPPAGTPVRVRTKECDSAAMVLANDHNIVVVRYESGMGFKYGGFDLDGVRPIRSEEDSAVEEMHPIIDEWLSDGPVEIAHALYRAGYRRVEA